MAELTDATQRTVSISEIICASSSVTTRMEWSWGTLIPQKMFFFYFTVCQQVQDSPSEWLPSTIWPGNGSIRDEKHFGSKLSIVSQVALLSRLFRDGFVGEARIQQGTTIDWCFPPENIGKVRVWQSSRDEIWFLQLTPNLLFPCCRVDIIKWSTSSGDYLDLHKSYTSTIEYKFVSELSETQKNFVVLFSNQLHHL